MKEERKQKERKMVYTKSKKCAEHVKSCHCSVIKEDNIKKKTVSWIILFGLRLNNVDPENNYIRYNKIWKSHLRIESVVEKLIS